MPERPAIESLLDPRSIAVVGASDSSRVGRAVLENPLRQGFRGPVYPVNPKYDRVLGLDCHPSLDAIPGPVDAVMISTATERVLPILAECARRGARAAVVAAAGFAESGGAGAQLQERMRSIAVEHGIALCGPNCMGILNTASGGSLYTGVLERAPRPGSVSAVLQSGSLGIALVNNDSGLRFRYLVSSGNEAVLTAADYVEYLVQDVGTTVIALCVEAIRDPERLLRAVVRAHAAGKPVVLLKLGVSDVSRALAASHTGALAGSAEVTADVCRQYGVVQVRDPEELAATCLLFAGAPPPAGPRAGVMTLSGGYATLAADLGEPAGLELPEWDPETVARLAPLTSARPRNPLDAWGTGDFRSSVRAILPALLSDRATDFVVVFQDLPPETACNGTDVPDAVAELAAELAAGSGKPLVVLGSLSDRPAPSRVERLEGRGIPYLAGAGAGIRALGHWARHRRRLQAAAHPGPRGAPQAAAPVDLALLRSVGLPVAEEALAGSVEEARAHAERIGYPVALKVASLDIPHKTEAGAIALDVGREDLSEAYRRVLARAAEAAPGAVVHGVAVQKQMPPGLEMIAGASEDPEWGWVVMCGLGGVSVELLRDVAFRRVPLSRADAEAMLRQLRSHALLAGFRRQPARDFESLAELLVAVSRLVEAHGDGLRQVEFNPVLVYERGAGLCIVDRLVVTREAGA